jgi:glycosyltransferase involved in cell wall biosynthesis
MRSVETDELPFVSVVVCTYNRKKLLKDCLSSIFSIEYPKSCYEVIIVDGGSNDGTEELCRGFHGIRFITESRARGRLAYARNKGAELASGSIVAYTDDDCIVDKCWLQNLVFGFQSFNNVVGVGGPVYPLHPEIIPRKILVKAALGLFDEGENMKPVQGFITANSAFKREIFKTIKFEETLGTTRRVKLWRGSDTVFCQNLINSGHKLLYTPFPKVYHQIVRERITVQYIIKHAVRSGLGTGLLIMKTRKNSRIRRIRIALALVVQHSLGIFSDRSFTSCYNLTYSLSTLFVCITGLDKVL